MEVERLRNVIAVACKKLKFPIEREEIVIAETKPEFGDLSTTVAFAIAKRIGKAPNEIAEQLSKEIALPATFESCAATGGYLNFKYSDKFYTNVLRKVLTKRKRFGSSNIGKGKVAVIDYSSPNIGKPLHIGHIRSTIIGDSVKKILSFVGYKTIGINLLSDVGKQVAMLIFALRKFKELPKIKNEKDMLKYYVRINKLLAERPEFEHDVRDILERIEAYDKRIVGELKRVRDLSMKAFMKNYALLGVKFDKFEMESNYVVQTKKIIDELLARKLAFVGKEGEVVADLEPHGLPNCILLRSNKTTTYEARDLGIANERYKRYKFDLAFYSTDFRQNLHFEQIFKILELLGRPYAKKCIHQGFGLIVFEEGIAATREGKVILLEDVLKDAITAAKAEIVARKGKGKGKRTNVRNARGMREIANLAKCIGIGAVKFDILRLTPEKTVTFDFKRMVSFEGETSAYVQYACVRARRILEKAKAKAKAKVAKGYVFNELERALLKKISQFQNVIERAAHSFQPYLVANYAIDVANAFSKFYEQVPVIQAPQNERSVRLGIVASAAITMKNALALLGIEVPEKM